MEGQEAREFQPAEKGFQATTLQKYAEKSPREFLQPEWTTTLKRYKTAKFGADGGQGDS